MEISGNVSNNMKTATILLIAFGALVMSLSIAKYYSVILAAEKLLSTAGQKISHWYKIHHCLMCFFLLGYIAVLLAVIFHIDIINNFMTGLIFFFGALFVLIGILLQRSLLLPITEQHQQIIKKNLQLTETENVTIYALAYLAETRDKETGQHLEKTTE